MKKIFYILLILVSIFGVTYLPNHFVIKQVKCRTQYGLCPFNIKPGKYMDVKKELKNLIVDNPNIKSYSSQIKLPNTLEVNIEIKKSIYSINQKDTTNYIFLDESGNILTIGDKTELPTVIVDKKLGNIGEKVESKYLFALKLVKGLNLMYQIKSGEIKNDSLLIELPPDLNVIFPLEGNADILLGSIRLIYEKINNDEDQKKFRRIDLRFKNPILE